MTVRVVGVLSGFTEDNHEAHEPHERTRKKTMVLTEQNDCVTFTVRVVPRSSRSEIVGEIDGALKVRLTSPPVDGAANAELVKLFAKKLGVSRSAVEIIGGETSKTKRLKVTGVTAEHVRSLLY